MRRPTVENPLTTPTPDKGEVGRGLYFLVLPCETPILVAGDTQKRSPVGIVSQHPPIFSLVLDTRGRAGAGIVDVRVSPVGRSRTQVGTFCPTTPHHPRGHAVDIVVHRPIRKTTHTLAPTFWIVPHTPQHMTVLVSNTKRAYLRSCNRTGTSWGQ